MSVAKLKRSHQLDLDAVVQNPGESKLNLMWFVAVLTKLCVNLRLSHIRLSPSACKDRSITSFDVYSLREFWRGIGDVSILHEVCERSLALNTDEKEWNCTCVLDASAHWRGNANHITFSKTKDLVIELHLTLATKAEVDFLVFFV